MFDFSIDTIERDCFTHTESGKKYSYSAAQFNKVFLIQYYPNAKRLSKHRAIGFTTMVKIVNNDRTINGLLEWAMSNEAIRPEFKLKDGGMFRFYRRNNF